MAISTITDNNKCCGCALCESICPHNAITMKFNEEGFLYPYINENLCIECMKCVNHCPINNINKLEANHFHRLVYACKNIDDEVLLKSSSGGVFSLLAEEVLNRGGLVFGVVFKNNKAVYTKAESIVDLFPMFGSKYIQSDKDRIWKEIKLYVKSGRLVLFCGTPCDVVALRTFLKKDYSNLLLVDFICMGVPSPLLFEKYLENIEKLYNSEISRLKFRDKRYGAFTLSLSIIFKNGKKYYREENSEPYIKAYHEKLFLRKSCHQCSFKGSKRFSDITISDFWGYEKFNLPFSHNKGVSMIIIQSEKGATFYSRIKNKLDTYELNLKIAESLQPMLCASSVPSDKRTAFFKDIFIHNKDVRRTLISYSNIRKLDIIRCYLKQNKVIRNLVRFFRK